MALRYKQRMFVAEYLRDFNATQAALRAGYSPRTAYAIGQENLKKPEIAKAIRAEIDARAMGNDEILIALAQQARSDIGVFFKLVEEWTEFPLPTQHVIEAKQEVDESDPDNPVTRTLFLVRHVALNLERLLDPKYSSLVKKVSASPRTGLSIELYDKKSALDSLARIRGMFIDRQEVTGANGGPIETKVIGDERHDRAISSLAAALREILPGSDAEPSGPMDAAEQAAVAGAADPGR